MIAASYDSDVLDVIAVELDGYRTAELIAAAHAEDARERSERLDALADQVADSLLEVPTTADTLRVWESVGGPLPLVSPDDLHPVRIMRDGVRNLVEEDPSEWVRWALIERRRLIPVSDGTRASVGDCFIVCPDGARYLAPLPCGLEELTVYWRDGDHYIAPLLWDLEELRVYWRDGLNAESGQVIPMDDATAARAPRFVDMGGGRVVVPVRDVPVAEVAAEYGPGVYVIAAVVEAPRGEHYREDGVAVVYVGDLHLID